MGIIKRRQRRKEDTRARIVEASLKIAKEQGWNALSMRKIADKIDYSVPVIYEYFAGKENLLHELTKIGYYNLIKEMHTAKLKHGKPEKQLEAMWLVYWKFAFAEKEFYQLMFGIEISSSSPRSRLSQSRLLASMIKEVIHKLVPVKDADGNKISGLYYTFWSVVHGLICLNMTGHRTPEPMSNQIMSHTFKGIIKSIRTP